MHEHAGRACAEFGCDGAGEHAGRACVETGAGARGSTRGERAGARGCPDEELCAPAGAGALGAGASSAGIRGACRGERESNTLGRDFGFPLRPADERGRTYIVTTLCARRLLLSGIQQCRPAQSGPGLTQFPNPGEIAPPGWATVISCPNTDRVCTRRADTHRHSHSSLRAVDPEQERKEGNGPQRWPRGVQGGSKILQLDWPFRPGIRSTNRHLV